jgi:2-keto-4-pentenoate hydratase
MTIDPKAVAAALLAAERGAGPVQTGEADLPDLAAAEAVHAALLAATGPAAGWKVSPTREPRGAPLLAGGVLEAGETPVAVPDGPMGVEVEAVFRVGRDVAAGEAFADDDAALDAIGSAHVGVELCWSRLDVGFDAPPLWKLADRQANGLFVVGAPIADWRGRDWRADAATLAIDGAPLAPLPGHPTGDPLRLAAWQIRDAAAFRGGLRRGALIATGSWSGFPLRRAPFTLSASLAGASIAFRAAPVGGATS